MKLEQSPFDRQKMIKQIVFIALTIFLLVGIAYGGEGTSDGARSERSEIFVQLGHGDDVYPVAFSPDGKYALSGSNDKTLKLWDIATGKEIRTFTGHTGRVKSVAFSPDGKYALSGSHDETIKLWDIATGREIRKFTGHTGCVSSVAFSPDGKYALSGSHGTYALPSLSPINDALRLWDIATGREIRKFTGHTGCVNSVAFSPDGKYALSGSHDATIKLWDIAAGREIRTFTGHKWYVYPVAFSPDGKYALSGSHDATIKLWDIAAGKEIRTFTGHKHFVSSVVFSPDGKYALSGSHDDTLKLWDIATGKEIRTFTGHGMTVNSVSYSPDGKYALSGSDDDTLKLWDIATGKEIRTFTGHTNEVTSVAFSPDGKYALAGNWKDPFFLWDVATGQAIRQFEGHTSWVKSVAFSPDGKYALSLTNDALKLWDIATGREIRTFPTYPDGSAVFSPDGKHALSGSRGDKKIKLWDIATGKEIRTFTGQEHFVSSVAFSPDGKYALSGGNFKAILWDIATGKEIRTFSEGHVSSVIFSPDGKYALTGHWDNIVKLWDLATGNNVRQFTGHANYVETVAFSPNGKYALSGSRDNTLKLWDVSTGKEIRTFTGHTYEVNSVAFSPDGKYALSGSSDGTTRIWEVSTGKENAQMVVFKDGEWIVITPEGYYNSSLNGHKYLNIRMGNNVYGIDQFYDVFYRPDIVTAKLKGEDINSLITLTIDDAIQNPPPTVEFTSQPSDTDKPNVKICYKVKSSGGGIGEVRLFHNGKLIQSDGYYKDLAKSPIAKTQLASLDGKAIYEDLRSIKIKAKDEIVSPLASKSKGEVFDDCAEVEATSGENEVSITAFNSTNTVQSYMKTMSFISKLPLQEPHLYILSIGIDQYKDKSITLKYAVKDAGDIKEKLLKQSTTLYKPQHIHHELLIDKEANKASIINKINELAKVIKPSDAFIMFVAGHGVLLQSQYFMLTHDFDGAVDDKSLISSNEIVEMSKKIKALSQLFIFDTCHAGGVDYIVSGLYDARMSVLAKKMGLHIYASANSKQQALDGYKGNGLFSYTLLDGLNNNIEADKNQDKKVSLIELGGYSKSNTVNISKRIGHSQTPLIINFGKDNALYNLTK